MKNKKDQIHLIFTGGTIDSAWNSEMDSIVVNTTSDIPDFFKKFPVVDVLTFTQVCLKDSRQLTDTDREQLLQSIEKSDANKIIITHGRFTVVDTVKFLSTKLQRKDQTIILTGGTTPLKGFEMSDSPFNLGFALAKVQDILPGIYIAMHGKLFSSEQLNSDISGDVFSKMFGSAAK